MNNSTFKFLQKVLKVSNYTAAKTISLKLKKNHRGELTMNMIIMQEARLSARRDCKRPPFPFWSSTTIVSLCSSRNRLTLSWLWKAI